MVTMSDVAKRAGVSQSTVSHHLNGTRSIHPDTQRAIRRALEETGYVHHAPAKSLRTQRATTVGLAISAITNPYFAELVRGIEDDLSRDSRSLLLVDTNDDPDREVAAIRQLLAQRPAAVLLAACRQTSPALELLQTYDTPAILIDRILPNPPPRVDAVGVHNRQPMHDLVTHLLDFGHRRIALLAGLPGVTTTEERIAGYLGAIATVPGAAPRIQHADRTASGTSAALDLLFADPPAPTALIGGNNQATISAMRWLTDHDYTVPEDVSLASFDDFEWATLFRPRLTAIRQPLADLGQAAVNLLARRLADPTRPGKTVRLHPRLIVRESTQRV